MRNLRTESEILKNWKVDVTKPLVSISCITYNHESYIRDAIEGFLMQRTTFPFKIFVLDDASTDRTAEIIREYESKYPKLFNCFHLKENTWGKPNRRELAKPFLEARNEGKYIALCEGDDYWTDNNKLQTQVNYMEQHPECTLCLHSSINVNKEREFLEKANYHKENLIATTEDIISETVAGHTTSMVFPASLAKCLPNYYFYAPIGDYPLKIYLASKGYAYYISKSMSAYRVGVGVSSLTLSKDTKINNYNRAKMMLKEFNKCTSYKYNKAVTHEIFRRKFRLEVGIMNLKEVKKNKYKKLYKALSFPNKSKLIIGCHFPILYKPAKKINFIIQKLVTSVRRIIVKSKYKS